MKRYAVIGGGLGGLSAALHLSRRPDTHIDLFETAAVCGGKAGTLSLDGFRFDTGPTLFTMDFVLRDLFHALGENMGDWLTLRPLDVSCAYHYPDGTVFTAYSAEERLVEETERVFGVEPRRFRRYIAYSRTIFDLVKDLFLFRSFHEPDMLFDSDLREAGRHFSRIDPFRTMHGANRSFFRDPRLVQYLDRYATFNGSSPFRAPATLNIIHYVEQFGSSVPQGGIRSIPDALIRLCGKRGVTLHTGIEVERIQREGRTVRGIRAGGRDREYHAVISNCDVRTTYERLLDVRWTPGALKYRLAEPSSSALVFFWGVQKESGLGTHTILFSANYRAEFRDLFSRLRVPADPTVYLYVSKRISPADSPAGCENWYVMLNAPRCRGQNWTNTVAAARAIVVRKIKERLGIDLTGRILCERVHTPRDIWRDTHSYWGSLYGLSSNGKTAAFLRQGNRSWYFRNLYFCGGSAHPGGGIPLTLLSGKITADLVEKYNG
ncbi:MAG TPA: phytoene desaturase [Spirochaetia bacterium]|nr:phytoene desaturase [Spirochaetia bacterium]